ncbi:MAG TPA: exopolysaccharide biosynthesis polyprenyl glycosylphosphotransferase [Candidatus Saccharimonadales bacterium]|nr:exopolysaccharide biosynthesis polyprenyl glycosylphosphotransferase [Candidatus Saccharimonadales bacterium]
MIRRLSLYEFFFRICCFLLPASAFLIGGTSLRALALIHPLSHDYVYLSVTLTLVWIVCSVHFRVTSIESLYFDSDGVQNCMKALAWTYMSGFSALFFYRGASYSRLLLGTSALILLGEVLLLRLVFRVIIDHAGKQKARIRIIIIGADAFAQKTSESLKNSKLAPCETVAFVRIPGQRVGVEPGVPVFELEHLMRQNIKHFANDMVLAASAEMLPMLSRLIDRLKDLAIPIRFCLDFGADVKVRDRFFRIGGTHMLDVHVAPSETINYVVLKRCFDIVFSALTLTIAAIPMALIAIAVKLSSPGPVFFKQERVGINGQVFKMLKFRTMKVAPSTVTDTAWTDDSRCTALGNFLRKGSFDELPQFFNVLWGDMSVVGPRPERPHFVEKFNDEIDAYNARHHLKAGITGWAQVNGLRGDTDISKRIELDLYYIQNWSMIFDFRIILMTVLSGIFAQSAY